jgi:hypothetical protein
MKAILGFGLALALQMAVSWHTVDAQASCRFVFGFAEFAARLGPGVVGTCLENQRTITGPESFTFPGVKVTIPSGWAVQRTTTGPLEWNPDSGNMIFEDNWGVRTLYLDGEYTALSWDEHLGTTSAPAPAVPAPATVPPRTPAEVARNHADAECFNIYANALIGTLYMGPAESDRVKAEADAANYLCHQAADRDGQKGVDCFSSAWNAAKGMERVFQGSGRKVYEDKYASCIGR